MAGGVILVAFTLAVAWRDYPPRIMGWFAFMLGAIGCQLWLAGSFQRTKPGVDAARRWAWRLQAITLLVAAGWGASVWMLPAARGNDAYITGVAQVLILAGWATALARRSLTTGQRLGCAGALLLPLALRFFLQADLTGAALGTCVVAFIVYAVSAGRRDRAILSDAFAARDESAARAREMIAHQASRQTREVELQEAHDRAASASDAKSEFVAAISHEIRTPLNGVLGMLRIVRDTPLQPEQRDYLKTAYDSAETLLLLLNDVLDLAKIEAGRLELHHAPFQPVAVAQSVADLMHARARDKGLELHLHIGANVPGAIIGDAARLRQVLTNLIGNAIKFTPRGRIDLAVTCEERTEARAVLLFSVSDTGVGIDSAALERLFKPFSGAAASTGRRYGGTGLGLAISKRLAEAMGGLLQVQSALNQGATFRLLLPCKLPAADAPTPASSAAPSPTPAFQGRVLVVEDDSVNRQVMELFLKKLRVAPTFAHDGESAISLAASEDFDVILMDCQLPGIDGLEATRRIRGANDGRRPVKIIALTASTGRSVRDACLAAGMNDFLTKPVRLEVLVEVLKRNLPTV